MKKVLVIFLFLFIIISYQNIIFASYNNEALEEKTQPHVQQAFKGRSKVWNQFLNGEYRSVDEIKGELETFIADPLLKSDVKMFGKMMKDPMSFEQISSVFIKDISIIKNNKDVVILDTVVIWTVLDYSETYEEKLRYTVEMKKNKDKWFLSDYEISK